MRILICALFLCLSSSVFAETEADVIASVRWLNPKATLKHKLSTIDGTLLGFDGGEWGGALVFLDKQGKSTKLGSENIRGLALAGSQILVFSGLAHMGLNNGKIHELIREISTPPALRELYVLGGCPTAIRQVDEQTISFLIYKGASNGKDAYTCKSIGGGVVSESQACTLPDDM